MHKSKAPPKKSRDRWGEWSDWVWDPNQQNHYRYRYNQDGKYHSEWAPPRQTAVAADPQIDETKPRRRDIDEITEGVQKLATADDYDYSGTAAASEATNYGTSPDQYAYTEPKSKSGKSKSSGGHSSNRRDNKGKSRAREERVDEEEEDEDEEQDDEEEGEGPAHVDYPQESEDPYQRRASTPKAHQQQPYETPSYQQQPQSHGSYAGYPGYGGQGYATAQAAGTAGYGTGGTAHSSGHGSGYGTSGYGSDPYGPSAYAQNAYGSSAYNSSQGSYPSTTSSYAPATSEPATEATEADREEEEAYQRLARESRQMYTQSQSREPGEPSAGSSSSAAGAYAPREYESEAEPTRSVTPTGIHIRGTGGDVEALDPRYRVEHSDAFRPGEVFKVLWPEPKGNVGGAPTISDWQEIRNQYGRFYVGFRRFIVIANDDGHCTCVPILTYGKKACNKKGVKPKKHGIIYHKGQSARPLPDEPKLGFPPVKMKIYVPGEKLAKESRVNYSKLMTVEHNVKVFFIGHIVPEEYELVRDAVNKCWEEKIHHDKYRSTGRSGK